MNRVGEGLLVTGDHGFVGAYVLDAASERFSWCAGLDRSKPETETRPAERGTQRAINRPYAHFTADLTEPASAKAAIEDLASTLGPPSHVLHLAAQASVGGSFRNPIATYQANVIGTAALLQSLADVAPQARVLVPSSAHVYGRPDRTDGLLREAAEPNPTTHYGVSKLAQEGIARVFHESRSLSCLVTRAFNHIGPGQGLGFVVPDLARRISVLERQGEGVLAVGNLEARRDYLDVRDVVQAYLTILDRGEPGSVYNVASGVSHSVEQLLDMMLAQLAPSAHIQVEQDPALLRPVDVPILVGDAGRLRALGWAPSYDIRDTVRDTLDYWRRRVAEEEAGSR